MWKSRNRKLRGRALLALLLLAFAGSSFLYGFWVRTTEKGPFQAVMSAYYRLRQIDALAAPFIWFQNRGRWSHGRFRPMTHQQADSLSLVQRQQVRKLEALGYLQGVERAPASVGVRRYDPERSYSGLNLYSSGHAPEAVLMDMEGRVLHRWRLSFEQAFPGVEAPLDASGVHFWRRVYLYPNGDLLAIYENLGLIKLDRNSKLQWALYNRSHHDIEVLDNGDIYVLTSKVHILPSVNKWRPVVEDFITVIGPDGVERRRYSLVEALQQSQYASLLSFAQDHGDFLHTNTLEVLDGRLEHLSPAFRRGGVLVSFRRIHTIAIVELESNQTIWARSGMWLDQHDPTLLANGHILLFDNHGDRGQSRVLELNPLTDEIAWDYYGNEENPFVTHCCGANQRLPNGSTLITETDAGRAFEVTPDGDIVWDFITPYRTGDHNELVASVFELLRLERDPIEQWLQR